MATATVQIDNGYVLDCAVAPDLALHVNDRCVVEDRHTQEFGHVLELREESEATPCRCSARVIRMATLQDQARADENVVMGKMALTKCKDKARKHNLDVRFVRVRYCFDRSFLSVLLTAEDRVDYRQLVKELAEELRTRVDMRQIGVRDEAAIVGGMGPCGRRLCCCSWMTDFASINVRMAKVQSFSLNPGSINGMCGRLKCCLRHEYEVYREQGKNLPKQGARVQCPDGKGTVVDRNILGQWVRVCLEDDRVLEYRGDEVKELWERRKNRRSEGDEGSGVERTESELAGDEGAGDLRD